MNETIIALATPLMKSALAIIRLSGEDSLSMTRKIFTGKTDGLKDREIRYGYLTKPDGEVIDEVVILFYQKPHGYTGENAVEIISHGSPLIIQEIISAYLSLGARLAVQGEFTSRAYLNGKIDLIQAEAVNDMINAASEEGKRLSLLSLKGETSQLIMPLKVLIADLVSLIEVNIDYPEYEDIEKVNREKIIVDTQKILDLTGKLIEEGRQGRIVKEGIKLALVGRPNVGKSSLLNALIKEDKAIVTPIPGTTRDVVEGEINLHGLILHIQDTAGIHESADLIESIGIDKSKKAILDADLIVVILDASSTISEEDEKILRLTENKKRIIVYNKSDLQSRKDEQKLYVSALKRDISALEKAIMHELGLTVDSYLRPSLNNARQIGLLQNIHRLVKKAQEDAENDLTVDLISVSLQAAYQETLALLGLESTTDLYQEIFARFCVGK